MKIIACTPFLLICSFALCQHYRYDQNGNLFSDANKQIAFMHYNYLNLADTIVFEDGHKIINTYTAAGTKLSQQVLLADGTSHKTRHYVDGFLYSDNVLSEIKHTAGRLMPILTGTDTLMEYQFHLIDHLGNVRSTITSLANTTTYTATMEINHAEQEERLFTGLSESRIKFLSANTTPGGQYVARLMNNTADGVSINIPVKSGDTLNLSVNAYYGGSPDEGQPAGPGIGSMLMLALSAMTGGLPVGGESQGAMLSSSGPAAGTALEISSDETIPDAHLNYVLFDRDSNFVDGGFVALTQAAATSPELLEIDSIYIRRSGILRVFLSNTSEQVIPVYFDDLKVEHTLTPEIQADSYDPFGLTLEEQHDERSGEVVNLNRFNGKELQLDSTLNWYDYGARMYDPALGRWHVVDPLAGKYPWVSAYVYALNNPVNLVDPDGMEPEKAYPLYNFNSTRAEKAQIKAMAWRLWEQGYRRQGALLRQYFEEGRVVIKSDLPDNVAAVITGPDSPFKKGHVLFGPKAGLTVGSLKNVIHELYHAGDPDTNPKEAYSYSNTPEGLEAYINRNLDGPYGEVDATIAGARYAAEQTLGLSGSERVEATNSFRGDIFVMQGGSAVDLADVLQRNPNITMKEIEALLPTVRQAIRIAKPRFIENGTKTYPQFYIEQFRAYWKQREAKGK